MQVEPAAPARRKLSAILQGELLFLLVAAAYLPSITGGFIWDDSSLITGNSAVVGVGGLGQIWTGHTLDYFPLTSTLFWAEWHLWGDDPRWYHLVTIMLHAAAVALLWLVLKRLEVRGAWLGALIFGLHPVCVESVAWISEGKNTLSLVLYAAALLTYIHFERVPQWGTYCLALGLFALALLAKTSVVMLPFVLLLFAWWRRSRITRRDVVRSIPFFLLSVVLGVVTVVFTHNAIVPSLVRLSGPWDRICLSGEIVWFYLGKALFPYPLITIYPGLRPLGIVPDLALIASLGALWSFRDTAWGRSLLFGLAYFVLSLAPVLGIFKMSYSVYSPVADHFQYIPLIAVAALAGAAVASIPVRNPGAVGFVLAAILTTATVLQQPPYQNEIAYWRRQVRFTPGSSTVYDHLGMALAQGGFAPEALEALQSAVRLDPQSAKTHEALGRVFIRLQRLEEAEIQIREALAIDKNSLAANVYLAELLYFQGRHDEGARQLRGVIQLHPDSATLHDELGSMLVAVGQLEAAVTEFQQALRLSPDLQPAQRHLDDTLFLLHRQDPSVR